MTTRTREPGEFCWINILSPDLPGTQAFFSRLLGWTFPEMGGMGFLIEVDGHRQGGLFDLHGPQTPPGQQPVIGVMVRVTDADAMAKRVKQLGGRALTPMDIGPNGRMVVCHDPGDANFDLWQVKGAPTSDVDGTKHGAMSWFELLSDDPARDVAFYGDLFGWTTETMAMPGFEYTTFKRDGEYVAGLAPIMPEMGDMKPAWGVYFTVDDLDVAARTAVEAGGTLLLEATDAPGVGRFCTILSPQGVSFSVMQYDPR